MSVIITYKNSDVIMCIGDKLGKQAVTGYTEVTLNMDGNESKVAYAFDVNAYDNVEIDKGVMTEVYCYTPDKGFYKNPDYIEPNKYGLPDELVQQIQDDTIADLIELGVL